MENQDKYSLWIVPHSDAGQKLQQFVDTLSDQFRAPHFVPHLTLIANLIVKSEQELISLKELIQKLAESVDTFDITLSGFDYKDEEFRCLYLLAEASSQLNSLYAAAAELFPQVADEHFAAMPHMSVLYGNYDATRKQEIIDNYKDSDVSTITFSVDSFDLFLTNAPTESWQLEQQFYLHN